MKSLVKTFSEGFLGAFKLAGAIVLAVLAVASSFTGHPHGNREPVDSRHGHI